MFRALIVAYGFLFLTLLGSAEGQPVQARSKAHITSPAGPAPNKLASKDAPAKPTPANEIGHCQIGVIPIAGNLFAIRKIGPIALADTYAHVGADNWQLDDLVVSRVRAAASGMSVRRISYTIAQLTQARNPDSIFRSSNAEMRDFVQEIAAGANCDRYLVVHRASGGKPVFGIGIVKFVDLLESHTYLHVLMHIRIYDGRTFELIKEVPARIKDESLLSLAYINPVGGPYLALDNRSYPASRAEAVADPILREGVRTLLAESLDKTLPATLR
jgi:hypothetical protein